MLKFNKKFFYSKNAFYICGIEIETIWKIRKKKKR